MDSDKLGKYREFRERFEIAATYSESSHFDRKLMREKATGAFYLYEFYERVDYSGGNDEIYETFTKVKDEADALDLNKERDIRRTPFYRIMPDFSIIEG